MQEALYVRQMLTDLPQGPQQQQQTIWIQMNAEINEKRIYKMPFWLSQQSDIDASI